MTTVPSAKSHFRQVRLTSLVEVAQNLVSRDIQPSMILLAWFIHDALETIARKAPNANDMHKATRPTKLLLAFGIPTILFTVILAGRIVWEETFLTIQQGPQMIGLAFVFNEYVGLS